MKTVLRVQHLRKTFPVSKGDRVVAVDNVSLDVQEGTVFTLLGPSGCGKTTTLRCIAGLERPEAGEITVGGRLFFSARQGVFVRANERGLGVVFQSYAVWPHMNVFDNVAFPLRVVPKRRRPSRTQVRGRVERALATVKLDQLAGRPATDLSGGQQQRLALARALVTEPSLLLLDEPLSNLDAKLREEMRLELRRLQRELGITSLYVTHDQIEALALSDVIAVMREGSIVQVGRPQEIYRRPGSRFVADFIGSSNLVDAVVERGARNGTYIVRTPQGLVQASSGDPLKTGARVVLAIRPEDIRLDGDGSGGALANNWRGSVQTRAFLGGAVDHVVAVGELELRVRSAPATSPSPGSAVTLSFEQDACWLIGVG